MGRTAKTIIGFIVAIAIIFGIFYIYKYGFRSPLEIYSSSTNTTAVGTTQTTQTTTSTTTSTNNGYGSLVNIVSNIDLKKIIEGIANFFGSILDWIVSNVKASDLRSTIIKGSLLSLAFFVVGFVAHMIVKVFRFIMYALGVTTIIFTIMIALGVL